MISLEQVTKTYTVEIEDFLYVVIVYHHMNIDVTIMEVLLEGLSLEEGSEEYNAVIDTFIAEVQPE